MQKLERNEGTRSAVGVIDERLYTKAVWRFYIYLYISYISSINTLVKISIVFQVTLGGPGGSMSWVVS